MSDSPRVGGDDYFSDHVVARPEDIEPDDLPPADSESIGQIDREALEKQNTIGKWQVTGSARRIEELWPELVADAEAGIIWAVKAMTAFGYEAIISVDFDCAYLYFHT